MMVEKSRPRLNGEGESDDVSQRRNHPGRHARRRMDRDLGAERCADRLFTQLVRNVADLEMCGTGVLPVSPDSPAGVERLAELGWRAHAERGVRMDRVVVGDPSGDEPEHRGGVGQGRDADVVALEGFDESLRHAVGLRAFDRREAEFQSQLLGEDARVFCGVGAANVRENFDTLKGT